MDVVEYSKTYEDIKMKLKIAVIASVLTMTGCAGLPYGEVVDVTSVGQQRVAAAQKAADGTFVFKSGTGLVYDKKNNQCGKNCEAHAQLAAEIEAKKAQEAINRKDEWEEREMNYRRESYRQEVVEICARGFQMHYSILEAKYQNSIRTDGFNGKATRAIAKEAQAFDNRKWQMIDGCVKANLDNHIRKAMGN